MEGLDAQRVPRRNAQGHAEVAVVPLHALQGVARWRGRRRGAARTVAQRHVEVFEDLALTADLGHRSGDGQRSQGVRTHGGAIRHGIDGHHDVGPYGADGGRVRGPVGQFAFEADLEVVGATGQVEVDRNGRDPGAVVERRRHGDQLAIKVNLHRATGQAGLSRIVHVVQTA